MGLVDQLAKAPRLTALFKLPLGLPFFNDDDSKLIATDSLLAPLRDIHQDEQQIGAMVSLRCTIGTWLSLRCTIGITIN